MVVENDHNSIEPEVMEVEGGDISQSSETLAEEATDNLVDLGQIVSNNGDKDGFEGFVGSTTNRVEQEIEVNSHIPEGMIEKLSTEETDLAHGHVSLNSSVVIAGSNFKFPIKSRYLSASIGSCHDLCKHGHKLESEKKIKRPMLRTIGEVQTLKMTTSDDLDISVLNKGIKNKKFNRRLSLPGPSTAEKVSPTYRKMIHSERDMNQLKLKRNQSDIKPSSVRAAAHSSSRSKGDAQYGKKMVVRSSNLLQNTSPRVKEIKSMKEVGSHNKRDQERANESMSNGMSPKIPLKKSPSFKARLYKNLRKFPHSKNQSISEEAKIEESDGFPGKTLRMIEPKTENKFMKKASKVASLTLGSPKTPQGSHVGKNKGFKGSQKGSRISNSSSSSQSEPVSMATTEPKPHHTKGENQHDSGSSSTNTKPIAKIKVDSGSKPNTPRAKSTRESKTNAKKRGTREPEENNSSSWKVKFKRGTVVALQAANSAPKKLRFKRGRVLGDDRNAKNENTRSMNNNVDTGNEPTDAKTMTGKVRLRHQEASEKKDNVDLNNVIEETASKLAVTRKSKVKALVGAFETVISLRDRKALVETGAS